MSLIDLNKFIGIPYKLGGRDFDGADCVGIIWLYLKANGILVHDNDGETYPKDWHKDDPERYRREILKEGKLVSRTHDDFVYDLKPMDILMFDAENTGDVSHAGIYLGYGRFLHSTEKGGSVISSFSNEWWRVRFRGAARIDKTYAGAPINEAWLEYARGPGAIIGAIIGGIIGTGGAAGGGYIFGATLWASIFAGVAYGSSIGGILENLGKSPEVESPTYEFGALGNTISNQLPVPIIYGYNKVAGNVIWQTDPGSIIERFVALCEGEINSIQDIRVNDIPIAELDGSSASEHLGTAAQAMDSRATVLTGEDKQTTYREEAHGNYDRVAGNIFTLGHIPVIADSEIVQIINNGPVWDFYEQVLSRDADYTINYTTGQITINPGLDTWLDGKPIYVTYNHQESMAADTQVVFGLRYLAYIAMTLAISDKLTGGDPTITSIVEGTKVQVWNGAVYVTQYSKNPAWCIRDFLLNSRYALGLSTADLDEQSFIDVANHCATLINKIDGSGTEERYQLDYVIDSRKSGIDILTEMLLTFGGFLVYSGGKFKLRVEKNESSVQAFTMDNIKNESFQYAKKAMSETPNRVIVEFRDPDNYWAMVEASAEDTIDQDDRGIVEKKISLYGIIRFSQASRIAKAILYTSKFNPRITQITVGIDSLHCEVGDIVTVSHDVPQWVNKPFRIVAIAEKDDDEMDLTLAEYNGSIFDDGFGSSIIFQNYSTLPHETQEPGHVRNLTVTEDTEYKPNLVITFNQPLQNVFWAYADILISTDGTTYKKVGESKGERFIFTDTVPGQKYWVKVLSVSTHDIRADSATAPVAIITVLGTAYIPPDVTGLEIFEMGNETYFLGKDCKFQWDWRSTKTGAGTIGAGNEALGAGEGHIDPYFMDFEVQILVGGVIKRTEHVTDNFYTYTFEKNEEDNGTPSATFTIRVWQRNIYNKISTNYAELTVTNPAPFQVQGLTVDFTGKDLIVYWAESSDLDLEYYKIDITGAGGTKTQYINGTRLVYPYDQNVKDHGGVGDPTLTVDVYAKDTFGQVSPVATIGAVNAVPAQLGTISSEGGFRSVSFWWSPSTETDLKHYKVRHKISTGAWSAWENITDNFYSRIMSSAEISTYGVTATIYFEAKAVDIFDQESAIAAAANDTAEDIKQIEMSGEIFQIKPTDSDGNTQATLKALYDGILSSGGVTYTITGATKYLQYEFPIEQTFNKVMLWPLATFNCYIGYSRDGSTWNYLKAEADHTLDANGKLLEATDQADAETNYWTTGTGSPVTGIWPYMRQAKYVRLYIKSTVTLYEVKFWTYAVLDEIDAGVLHLAKGLSISSVDDNTNAVLMDTTGLKAYYNSTELGQTRLTRITGDKGLESLLDGVVKVQVGRLASGVFGLWSTVGGFGGTIASPKIEIKDDGLWVAAGASIRLFRDTTSPAELRWPISYAGTQYFSLRADAASPGGLHLKSIGFQGDFYIGESSNVLNLFRVYCLGTEITGTLAVSGKIYSFTDGVSSLGELAGAFSRRFAFLALYPTTAPGSPAAGAVYYDSTANKLKMYNGSAWETITSS